YAYCMLAAGHIDLVIETELKPYDVLPLMPIITGAGGIITTWDNGKPNDGGRIIAAGDKRVHAAALELLKGSGMKPFPPAPEHAITEQRRARHEGVERRQRLAAVAILLHQQFVAGARHDQVRARPQPDREVIDRRR